ncbi:MAG: hypothetical protein HRT61_04650 [Ekhidna sp.]|nr:hypothetical protein [Ekhidna sp.]
MKLGEMGFLEFRFDDDSKQFQYYLDYSARIKVFDVTDASQGDIKIRLYQPENNFSVEKVYGFKANVYNLVNGKVEKQKVEKKELFSKRINDYWIELSVAIPNIQAGTIFEYSYKKLSDFTYNLTDWIFQDDIPVAKSSFTYTIPEYFKYQQNFLGNTYNVESESSKFEETFNYSVANNLGNGQFGVGVQRGSITSQSTKTTVQMSNIMPLEDEPYSVNRSDIPSRIEFQLVSTSYPNQPTEVVAGNYDKFNAELLSRTDLGSVMKKGGFLPKELDLEIQSLGNENRIAFLYKHIQKSIKWDGFKGYLSSEVGKITYNNGEGSVSDINLTLIALLRNYDIEASPVIFSTRGNGTIHPVYPSYDEFDYVIAAIELPNQLILLDASSSLPLGILPLKCRNGKGWLVHHNRGRMIDLKSKSIYSVSSTNKCQISDEKVSIEANKTFKDYASLSRSKQDSISMVESFKKEISNSDFSVLNVSLLDYAVGESTSYDYSLEAEMADEIYFQPILDGTVLENPFKREKRTSIIDFPYNQSYRVVTQVNYPKDYKVELPESTRFNLPDKKGSFSYSVSQTDGVITVISNLKVSAKEFGINEYPALRQFYQLVADKNQELIVFTK